MKDLSRRLFIFAAATLAATAAAIGTGPVRARGVYEHAFQNPDLPVERRVDDLLAAMTLDEKVACLGTNPSVPRLGVKGAGHMEGIHGLAAGGPAKWGGKVTMPTTTFPQGIGLGETWDPEIVRRAGAVEGFEARYLFQNPKYDATRHGLVIRAPNADLGRDPRWGRTEECYGEDPYFNGTMAVALVRGLQGDDPKYWQTAALMKHFLANSWEDERTRASSDFDERLFREYYSVPFRMGVVEGGSRAYMAAYNRVNGVPCTVNPILRDVTVKEWGEDGIICTDGGAMRLLVTDHKYFPDLPHAAAATVKAGVGQFLDDYRDATKTALATGLLAESDVDAALRGTFRVMIRLGLLDPPERVPYASIGRGPEPWLSEEHKAVARLATRESVVLLKNEKNALPLDSRRLKSVAVVGPRANEVDLDWYSGTPPYTVTPLDGIKAKVGAGVKVTYADGADRDAAAELARAADVAVVCVGNHPTCAAGWAQCPLPSDGKEAVDRKSLTLEDEELVKRVLAANPRTVVVLVASFPFAINWTEANVPAIVHLAHNSQEEGTAVADVLFGDYNPAGRLVQTWPASVDDLPPISDFDIRRGRTYLYARARPLYPFGFGLSYTTFGYSKLRTSAPGLGAAGTIDVSVDVTNTGRRAGEEVVQMYVSHVGSSVARPISELKGFRRIALRPGETKTVTMPLAAAALAYWDVASHAFVVEADRVHVGVGRSSADLPVATTVRVDGARAGS
jgi:beta-glucosidase